MAMAIIGDVFPEERRGRATGSLMTGFALASVAGVPLGQVLGTHFGWHVPFVTLAIAGIPALVLTPFALPPLDGHVGKSHEHPLRSLVETFSHANHLKSFALIVTLMVGSFAVFPYLSVFLVGNIGITEKQLSLLYVAGGVLTLAAAPVVGRLADRLGKLRVYRIIAPGSAVMFLVLTHLPPVHAGVAIALFGVMMAFNVGRMIPAMAMVTSSVEPRRRGGFLSANASLQHVASGIGASIGGAIISENADGKLEHFGTVGWIAAGATLLSLWLAGRVRVADGGTTSAEAISMAAAAEASADAGEPLMEVS
jgi:MFS transporter, DHA1 family, inner membrane transport protein